MTRKIHLRTNDEILKSRGRTQKFSSYPQLKPRLVFDSEDAMKEYMRSKEVRLVDSKTTSRSFT